jgi:hypothetical protein
MGHTIYTRIYTGICFRYSERFAVELWRVRNGKESLTEQVGAYNFEKNSQTT